MRVPHAHLAELDENGEIRALNTETLFSGVKALVIGVPGAFTPVCTREHLPPFIANADRFRASGFQHVVCLATSDPFSLDAWARQIDPDRKLRYVSDGNLEFTRAAGLISHEPGLFLGERSKRYAMTLDSAIVTRLSVEASVLDVQCSALDLML